MRPGARAIVGLLLLPAALAVTIAAPRLPLPELPVPVKGLVYARPFVLERAYAGYDGEALFDRGYLVVLEIDPLLLEPRATTEPLVVAGDRLVHRLNVGASCGWLVGIVPGQLDLPRAALWIDRADSDVLDAAVVGASRARAAALGFAAPPAEQVRAALDRGGTVLALPDARGLLAAAGGVVEEYCSDEREVYRSLQGRPPER